MTPNPVSQVRADAAIRAWWDLPSELCLDVAEIVRRWAFVEAALLRMTQSFLQAEFTLVASMLLKIDNMGSRRAALHGAAEKRLQGDDLALWRACFTAMRRAEEVRNKWVHSHWAGAPEIPNAILLIDPRHLEAWHAEANEKEEFPRLDRDKVMVYRKADLESDLRDVSEAVHIVEHLEEWVGWVMVDAPELAAGEREILLDEFPRVKRAYVQRST